MRRNTQSRRPTLAVLNERRLSRLSRPTQQQEWEAANPTNYRKFLPTVLLSQDKNLIRVLMLAAVVNSHRLLVQHEAGDQHVENLDAGPISRQADEASDKRTATRHIVFLSP